MTTWTDSEGGRARGPAAVGRAWVAVLRSPRRFFREGVAPGDQAPGLVFAMVVVFLEEALRFALVAGAYPVVGGRPLLSAVLWLGVATFLVAPAALHLTAAAQTVLLVPFVPERGGVSETVQVLGYAAAPCVLAGLPFPAVRVFVAGWGVWLLALGVAEVHGTGLGRAALLSGLPAAGVFGYGFRGFAALGELLSRWYII